MFHKILIRDANSGCWLSFSDPYRIYCVTSIADIIAVLERIEVDVFEKNMWAAGWISYEAAPAFDETLVTHTSSEFPVLWFGTFMQCKPISLENFITSDHVSAFQDMVWNLNTESLTYVDKINRIKSEIRQGNSYQVNYTIRQFADMDIPPEDAFLSFAADARYGAFINSGRFVLCSASPELFFTIEKDEIYSRPMKGTAPRGRYLEEDNRLRDELFMCEKNRAENLMVVDMIRNDIGKIAQPGSVRVPKLFAIEKYPTVWQMTSTVTASVKASLVDIFKSLFPCASVTGAPKANTMKIIHQLECSVRNIYTGTIGFIRPDMSMQFNVAIRTILIDKQLNQAEYGVGGGVVWDSSAEDEYKECLTKSEILSGYGIYTHKLMETILWSPDSGFFLLDYHFRRLRQSAEYFDYPCNLDKIESSLMALAKSMDQIMRVRLLVSKNGKFELQHSRLTPFTVDKNYAVKLAKQPIERSNVYLYHKTTQRLIYNFYKKLYPDYNDVLLINERGEITEATIANLVVEIKGQKFTPPINCGLLNGTYRQFLLDQQLLEQRVITKELLKKANKYYLINSVRKMWPIDVVI